MKIIYVASTKSHIMSFHLPYLEQFKALGHSVCTAYAGDDDPCPYADMVLQLPFEKSMSSFSNFKAARILRGHLRAEKYDAVIVHTSLAAFFTRLALIGLRKRPRVINMVHGYLFDENTPLLKRSVLTLSEKLTAPVTDLLITMNRSDFDLAKKKRFAKHVRFVPGVGVDEKRFSDLEMNKTEARNKLGIPEKAFVLIYPAEFSSRKSQHVLIKAMAELEDRVVLLLPGKGEKLDECMALARSLGQAQRVIFPGFVDDMPLWYLASDCACTSSRSEGLPFNVMEAMMSHLPIVASDVKGHNDLIDNEVTGLLYPYGDHIACAEAIERLKSSDEFLKSLADNAYEAVKKYTLNEVMPIVMGEYLSVLE